MKKITLKLDGKKKTYSIDYINGYQWRKYVLLRSEFEDQNILNIEEVDSLVEYVVELFENKFTFDEFYMGVNYEEIVSTIADLFSPAQDEVDEGKK